METWVSWLDNISKRVTAIPGVTADVRQPRGLSNRSPGLTIRWDPVKFGISGEEVAQHLYITEPRIALGGGGAAAGRGAQNGLTSIGISASMMAPGNDKVVADRVYEILSKPRPPKPPTSPTPRRPTSAEYGTCRSTSSPAAPITRSPSSRKGTASQECIRRFRRARPEWNDRWRQRPYLQQHSREQFRRPPGVHVHRQSERQRNVGRSRYRRIFQCQVDRAKHTPRPGLPLG
jgi:hypothetical protein